MFSPKGQTFASDMRCHCNILPKPGYRRRMGEAAATYTRRTPEQTVLYGVLASHVDAFRQDLASKGKYLPEYVEREFEAYFDCGMLERGFARIQCMDCDHEKLLAFSCKRRGFCPSCCGRRMTEAEIRIIEEVFPRVQARQWVLSLPMPLRFLCSRDRPMLNLVVNIFYEEISKFIAKKLGLRGIKDAQTGGFLVIQRLGGSLNLNVHLHGVFLDGGYVYDEKAKKHVFHDLGDALTSEDVAAVVEKIAKRSFKTLEKKGFLEGGEASTGDAEPDAAALCDGASLKNMIAFGPRAGQAVRRIRLPMDETTAQIRGDLVAQMNWFNLKADKVVKAHQRWKLARLVRYVTRPPLANERLVLADDGTVRYKMKAPWSDGTVEIQLSGIELVEKLASAVPPPNGHLLRYFGVLAPNAKIRKEIVLVPKPKARDESGKLLASATQRASWAALAKQAFGLDLTKCEVCGGPVRRLAVIRNPGVIAKILRHVGFAGSQAGPWRSPRPPPSEGVTYEPLCDDSCDAPEA